MKNIIFFNIIVGIILIISGIILNYQSYIQSLYNEITNNKNLENMELKIQNEYFREYDFNYVQNTKNITPNSYQELLNLLYTIINYGYNEFTFTCSEEYKRCIDDIKIISQDQEILSNINNYVHTYNSFEKAEISYNLKNQINIKLKKTYTTNQIEELNTTIDNIYNNLINESDNQYDSILKIHDYIISNSKYDTNRTENGILLYHSDIAYGPLIEGYSLCGGYTDAMQLFLEKMNIKNFKVLSKNHIWNALVLNGKWYNLDLTWDDPITSTGIDVLYHSYFLIDTATLTSLDTTEHTFSIENFSELKST